MSKNIFIFVLAIALVIGGYGFNKYYGKKLGALYAKLNYSDMLIREKDGLIGRQGAKIKNQEDALSHLSANVQEVIKERDLLLSENVSMSLRIDSFFTQLSIGDAKTDSVGATFYPLGPERWGIFSIDGKLWSPCKPSKFEWGIRQVDPFELSISLAGTKDRTLKFAFANSSWKDVKIDTVIFDYIPYSPPWYSNLFVDAGVQSSLNEKTPVGVQLGFGYDKIVVGMVIDSHARSYYVNYRWNPFQ
jgi:hypothetical protein